jgi:hypothetical protein
VLGKHSLALHAQRLFASILFFCISMAARASPSCARAYLKCVDDRPPPCASIPFVIADTLVHPSWIAQQARLALQYRLFINEHALRRPVPVCKAVRLAARQSQRDMPSSLLHNITHNMEIPQPLGWLSSRRARCAAPGWSGRLPPEAHSYHVVWRAPHPGWD